MDMLATCPACGRTNEAVKGLSGEAVPADGDRTICFGCGVWSVFVVNAVGVTQRLPNDAEAGELADDPRVQQISEQWAADRQALLRRGRS